MTQPPPEAPSGKDTAVWRLLVQKPLMWALLCTATALPWVLSGHGMDLPPFLIGLVGGWLCGFAFVNATLEMHNPKHGALVHLAGAMVFSLSLHWYVFQGSRQFIDLPQVATSLVYSAQMAAIPAVAWIWLGLIHRFSHCVSRPSDRRKKAPPAVPQWQLEDPGTAVHFHAVAMTVRTLTWIFTAVFAVVAALLNYVLFTFDWFMNTGSSTVIVLLCGALGLPALLLVKSILGRKTIACSVHFTRDRLRIDTETWSSSIALAQLEHLSWRSDGSYARLQARGPGMDVSLIVGLARMPEATLPNLPPLSQQTMQRLIQAGLVKRRGRWPTLVQFDAGPFPTGKHHRRTSGNGF